MTTDTLPLYVFYDNECKTFFHVDGIQMSNSFADRWRARASEFPTNKRLAINKTFNELSKFCAPSQVPWSGQPRKQFHPRAEVPTALEMGLAVNLLFNTIPAIEDDKMRSACVQVASWLRDKVEDVK